MFKVITGTPTKCKEWAAGTNDDADYSNHVSFKAGINLTKTKDRGAVTGIIGENRSFELFETGGMTPVQEGWLIFLIWCESDRTINYIYFGGIVTGVSDSQLGYDNSNNPINVVDVKATSFEW